MAALDSNPDPRVQQRSRAEPAISTRTLRLFDSAMETRAEASPAPDAPSTPTPGHAMRACGNALFRRGRHQEALAAFEQAETLCREAGDARGCARSIESRADLLCALDRPSEALAAYQNAASLDDRVGDAASQGYCAWSCGDMLTVLGRHAEALAAYQHAAALFHQTGDRRSRCHCIRSGGDALAHLGRLTEALDTCQQAQELFHEAGDTPGLGRCVQSCADTLARLGQSEDALAAFEQAESFFRAAGHDPGLGHCIECRGDLLADLGRNQQALLAYEQAGGLLRRVGDDAGRARCLWAWGDIAMALHQPDEALPEYKIALELFMKTDTRAEAAILAVKVLHTAGQSVALHGLDLARQASEIVRRLTRQIDQLDAVQNGLVHFMVRTSAALSPTDALELLGGIQAALPASHRDLLEPARLALEVAAGHREPALPDQTDLMRRAVHKFGDQLTAAQARPPTG